MPEAARRRQGNAVFLSPHGDCKQLNRVSARATGHDEDWLQQLLFGNPSALEVADSAEDVYFPLVPLGREVPTPAGPIDLLYVSPSGYLTLVETKLWENPESRREVLAQTLDYAKELSGWTYHDVDTNVRRAKAPAPASDGVFPCVLRSNVTDLTVADEPAFADRVTRNLVRGRFHLVIAGDRIHPSVESLVAFTQRYASLQYTVSLIEFEIYRPLEDALLIVPAVVGRTVEIERLVVRIEPPDHPAVTLETPLTRTDGRQGSPAPRRQNLSEDEFYGALDAAHPGDAGICQRLLTMTDAIGGYLDWKSASVTVKLPVPNSGSQDLSLYSVYAKEGTVWTDMLGQQLPRAGLAAELALPFVAGVARLVGVTVPNDRGAKVTWPHWSRRVRLAEIAPVMDQFRTLAEAFAEEVRRHDETR